jgi:replicative DNA helicase
MIRSVSGEGEDRNRRQQKKPAVVERLPPHAPEGETGVLGCIILSPDDTMPESIERLRAEGREFYDLRHFTIWECLVDMYDRGTPIDVISIQEELKRKDMLEQVGGISYLASLPDTVPSAANLSYYLDLIREKYILRMAIVVCTEVVSDIYEYVGEVDALMDKIERDLINIREQRTDPKLSDIKSLVVESMRIIEESSQRETTVTGLSTGYSDLDRMTSGLQNSEMVVIAARPSMGKTSLAMNIVENIAIGRGLPVGVFSLEMSAPALTMRMLCSQARVNLRNVRDGFLNDRDFPKLVGAAGRLQKSPIYIDDTAGMSVMQLRAKARRMAARYGIKLAVVDYLQLLRSDRRTESRQQEVSDIARAIKNLAKELNIPIIALSQLNREVERDKKRKPRLADLRESGELEQSADLVAFLYRPNTDEDASESDFTALRVNLLIGKQRNGPTGDVPLTFLKEYTRFESAAKVSDEDVPEQGQLV